MYRIITTILIRISDNVLDTEDWPIWLLLYNNEGMLFKSVLVKEGAYSRLGSYECPTHGTCPLHIGSTLEDLEKWEQYDSTGHHPEEYHSFKIFNPEGDIHNWHDPQEKVFLKSLISLSKDQLDQRIKRDKL